MTFAEKLDRAKTGSRAAYESLCLGSVDGLYTTALIALKSEPAAGNAVISAIADGYAGISRIKDERHLRSWLVHELTKHIVDMLKEFKANGTLNTAFGTFAATECLPDVERLVFAVSISFGYGNRELSVLTGMSEDNVSDKLASARSRLGNDYDTISNAASASRAPEGLKARYRAFDESLARIEKEAAASEAQKTAVQPEQPQTAPTVEETPFLREIPMQPAPPVNVAASQEIPFLREIEIPTRHETGDEAYTPVLPVEPDDDDTATDNEETDNAGGTGGDMEPPLFRTAEIYKNSKPRSKPDESAVFADENTELEALPAGQSAAEKFSVSEESVNDGNNLTLNAETFIAVVSAEQMKGSEFLRLIGNTRISNSAYREIEQNPGLTKERLIELLEQSGLGEADYYKLLTAVKHRRELINAREESRMIHERAGLFDGSQRTPARRRRRRETPKSELQMAIGVDLPKKDVPLSIDEKRILDDENDYEIKNAGSDRFPRSPIITGNRKSLGAVINEGSRSRPAENKNFSDSVSEIAAVDPIAAILAKETGDQAKPRRLGGQNDEPLTVPKEKNEEHSETADDIIPDITGKTSDTKEFDITQQETNGYSLEFSGSRLERDQTVDIRFTDEQYSPELPDDRQQSETETEPEKGSALSEPANNLQFSYVPEDDEPDIETIPVSAGDGMSVTQILSEYSGKSGGASGVSGVTAILEGLGTAMKKTGPEEEKNEGSAAESNDFIQRGSIEYTPPAPASEDNSSKTDDEGGYTPENAPKFFNTQELDGSYISGAVNDDDEPEIVTSPVRTVNPASSGVTAIIEEFATPKTTGDNTPTAPDIRPDAPAPAAPVSSDTGTFTPPQLDLADDTGDEDDDDEDDDDDTFGAEKQSPKKEKRRAEDEDFDDGDESYDEDDTGEIEKPRFDENEEEEEPRRNRYKGNEYFHDDDEYYEGVNRGKLIFCIVCAVLLVAGAAAMKYVFNKNKPETAPDNGGGTSISDSGGTVPSEPSGQPADDSQILTKLTEFEDGTAQTSELTSQYMRASGKPYSPFLSENMIQADDTLYIYSDGRLRAVSLDPDNPKLTAETGISSGDSNEEFIGLTVFNDKIYTVSQEKKPASEDDFTSVLIRTYNKDLTQDGDIYGICGKFCGMGISGGKLIAVTYLPNQGRDPGTGAAISYPSSTVTSLDDPSGIIKLNGAESHGYAVIGEVGGSGLTAICGCMMAYPKFDDNGGNFILLAADEKQTFAVELDQSLEALNAKRYAGRAFSADCLNGDRFIGANYTDKICGITAAVGKNAIATAVEGETPNSVAWTEDGNTACAVAKQDNGNLILYGFDMSGESPAAAAVTRDTIYMDKLIPAGGKLIGLSAADENAGLRLSCYEYDGKLTEISHAVIGLDDQGKMLELKYLRSAAVSDPGMIAVSPDGRIAVPTSYKGEFSEKERVVVFDSTLTQTGDVLLYDEKSSVLCAAFSGSTLYVVTDSHIITANASDCSSQKTFEIG